MYTRGLNDKVADALADTPVVLVNGARQSGKTTLVQKMVGDHPGAIPRRSHVPIRPGARPGSAPT